MAKHPDRIGKYTILELIAKGGMGAVYKGIHPTLNRHVILKKLTLKGSSAITERFKREARIMMDFKNDHIVDVYDHFKEGKSYYIVQEFVDGIALDGLIKKERYLPNDIALLIFLDACKALCYAHNKNVIHRDVKPANILLSKAGEIKLVDFGIATSEEDSDEGLTKEGMTLGTPSYMAPEQFQNTKNVDKRADIYSMGISLYEMVSGKRPYPGNLESVMLIQKGKYKPVRKVNPKVSPFVRKIIKKTMQAKPKRRYQNLDKVISLVQKYLKNRNIPAIRKRLIKVIKGEQVEQEPRNRMTSVKRMLATVFTVIILLIAGGLFAYISNYHYEWFLSEKYGAVKVTTKIDKSLKKDTDEIYILAQLFTDDDDKIPEVKEADIKMKEIKARETKSHIVFESRVIYFKPGHYRLKLSIENQVFWNSYYLNPRVVQRENVKTKDARLIEFVFVPGSSLPVDVKFTIKDQLTGKDIAKGTTIQYRGNKKNKWEDWSAKAAKEVTSGKSHYFKFSREGYFDKIFDPFIKTFQNQLNLEADLIPKPGEINISSGLANIPFKLDGSVYYRSGDELGLTKKLLPAGKKQQQIILAPGKHKLTAGPYKGSKEISIDISLKTGQKISVTMEYDQKTKSLTINTK